MNKTLTIEYPDSLYQRNIVFTEVTLDGDRIVFTARDAASDEFIGTRIDYPWSIEYQGDFLDPMDVLNTVKYLLTTNAPRVRAARVAVVVYKDMCTVCSAKEPRKNPA